MNKMLTLTIVIPVYNEQDHLAACLDSIAAQTVIPTEVIVVDNNSTDQSAEIAGRYGFVRVVRERKAGVVYARNCGFNAVRSELIGRIDADTLLPPTWVADVLRAYGSSQDFALTGGGYFYNIPWRWFNSWMHNQLAFRTNRFIMGHYIVWGSNMVLPRALWRRVRADICLRNDIHEDLDLAIHLHRRGVPISYQAGLEVGVKMRRVLADQHQLRENMDWWPRTLSVHGLRRAWLGRLGADFLYYGSSFVRLAENGRLMARRLSAARRYLAARYSGPTDRG